MRSVDNAQLQTAEQSLRTRALAAARSRPLLVLSGWRAPPIAAWSLARTLRPLGGGGPPVVHLSFMLRNDLGSMASLVRRRVHERLGADAAGGIDVVGVSMGGLVARAAAIAEGKGGAPPVRIARLFTLATPHRGAKLARYIAPDAAARAMRPGSEALRQLDEHLAMTVPSLTCYARLHDTWVGATNTAPPGHEPIWLDGPRVGAHHLISLDRRIVLDVALRLAGDAPLLPDAWATRPPHD